MRVKATYEGREVRGTMIDHGLVGCGYMSIFHLGTVTIASVFPRDEAEKNFNSIQMRLCHDKNTLAAHGFEDLELDEFGADPRTEGPDAAT